VGPPTWALTERHRAVGALVLACSVASLSGLSEDQPLPSWVAVAVVVAALPSLALDVWGGALVGLAVAALLVAVRQAADLWGPDVFGPALVETVALFAVGALAGRAGARLRPVTRPAAGSHIAPVHGSLGLIDEAAATARLEEEVIRSRRYGRTVSLALLDVHLTEDGLPVEGRRAACRAVARLVEGRSEPAHVPFALADDRFGIVMPDTGAAAAWEVVGRVLEAVGTTEVTYGAGRISRSLHDTVEVLAGISQHGPRRDSAAAMFADARRAIERVVDEDGRGVG
jgi:GGDEF domain-containing protein